MKNSFFITENKKFLPILLGPSAFILCTVLPSPEAEHPTLLIMIGITLWIGLWWLTEVVHIAVTSLLPFLLLPITGVADIKIVSAQYMDPILFLFIGGFLIAFAIERWGLHRRLALNILSFTGKTISSLLFGIMLTTYMMSMWISNTATVMMLISAVMAVILHLKSYIGNSNSHRKISSALLIGLAYAASIGGMATLVGTPTNMIFFRVYNENFGSQHPINFINWMSFACPMSFLLLLFTFFLLKLLLVGKSSGISLDQTFFKKERKILGPWNPDEKVVAIVFIITAVLWLTRADLQIGDLLLKGWSSYFPFPEQISDGSVSICMAILLFLIPSQTEKNRSLLNWSEASKLPYEIVLLFGSGFAIAKGFESSGLSEWLAIHLKSFNEIPVAIMILSICIVVTIISEFASNVASIQLILPVLISMLGSFKAEPATLLVPAALSASLGFMLPIATAPNTIVFSSGYIRVREMAMVGFFVDLIGILLISIFSVYFV